MSLQRSATPISVVIFDRSQRYGTDVPVFSQALKKKINTAPTRLLEEAVLSPSAQAILDSLGTKKHTVEIPPQEQSHQALCADSLGGQTSEFAQSALIENSVPSVQQAIAVVEEEKNTKSTIAPYDLHEVFVPTEDPTLIRFHHDSTQLIRAILPGGNVSSIPRVIRVPPRVIPLLCASHKCGSIDRVVLPMRTPSFFSRFEETTVYYRRGTKRLLRGVQRFPSYLRTVVLVLLSTLESHRTGLSVRLSVRMQQTGASIISAYRSIRKRLASLVVLRRPSLWGVTWLRRILRESGSELWSYLRDIVAQTHSQMRFAQVASKLLISGSLVLMLLTIGPMVALEAQSWKKQIMYSLSSLASRAVEQQFPSTSPVAVTPTPVPTPHPDPEKQFQIQIPKIGVNSKVIANVDASSEQAYDIALKKGVAHAAGTGLPGEENTINKSIFIFGHSTNGAWNISKYNALFYALKDLVTGDVIKIWFWGKEYSYVVKETKVVSADDVSFLQPQQESERLILQTCWPPGTTWKRFIVIAQPQI